MFSTNKSYVSINNENNENNIENIPNENASCMKKMLCGMDCNYIKYCILCFLGAIIFSVVLCFTIIAIICVINVLFGILMVICNYTLETSITFLFGKEIYKKMFPICSMSDYNINSGCYTKTSVYC